MCVIIACEKTYPSMQTLESAESLNQDGGGIAWIEKGIVHYKKGLSMDAKQIYKITQKIQLPFIIHFRITSVGSTKPALCHPFPITHKAETSLLGTAKAVIFHNGTWTDWEHCMLATLLDKQVKMPRGSWSDSRAMAFIAAHTNKKILKKIVTGWNKMAILTPKGIEYYGDQWAKIAEKDEITLKCSNDYFLPKPEIAGINDGYYNPYNFIHIPKDIRAPIRKMTKEEKADQLTLMLHDVGYSYFETDRIVQRSIEHNTLDKDLKTDWYQEYYSGGGWQDAELYDYKQIQ